MVTLDSSISFLIYITAVSSAAAGVTEAVKVAVPFLGTEYEPHEDRLEDHNAAARLHNAKKLCHLFISVLAAGIIFGMLGLDPALILAGNSSAYVEQPWEAGVWIWGIVAVFGAPFFHSLLKILEGLKLNVNSSQLPPPKARQKVKGNR